MKKFNVESPNTWHRLAIGLIGVVLILATIPLMVIDQNVNPAGGDFLGLLAIVGILAGVAAVVIAWKESLEHYLVRALIVVRLAEWPQKAEEGDEGCAELRIGIHRIPDSR